MLQCPKELQFYFMISFFKVILWLSFQMPVFGIDSIIELLTVLTFLISAIRFQSKQLNCCCFQQVYLAALFVQWSQVPPNSNCRETADIPETTDKGSTEINNMKT